ncbi:unnamed protein product [Closterium sp. Naga37s-1]|nr:unnamed protein product [Closterium sp. Naga37s-1]
MALASLACASPSIAASSLAFAAARATSFRRHCGDAARAALALRLPLMRPPFPALLADPSGLCARNHPPLRAQPQPQAQSQSQPRPHVPMAARGGGKGYGVSSGTSPSRRSSAGGRGGRAGGGGGGGGGSGRGGGGGLADARSSDPAETFGLPERSVALNELMRVRTSPLSSNPLTPSLPPFFPRMSTERARVCVRLLAFPVLPRSSTRSTLFPNHHPPLLEIPPFFVLLEEEMRPPHERMQHAREQRDLAEAALETRQRWDRRREARGRRAEKQGRAEAAMDAMDAEEAAIAAAMAKVKPGDPSQFKLLRHVSSRAPPFSAPPPSPASPLPSPFPPLPRRPRQATHSHPLVPTLPPPPLAPPLAPRSLIPAEEELQMFKEWAARKLRGAPRGAEGVAVARGLAHMRHMRRTLEGAAREEQGARTRGDAGGSGGSGGIGEIGGSGESREVKGRVGAGGRGDGGERGGGVRGRKGSEGGRVEQGWERDQREWGTMWAKGGGGRVAGEGGRCGLGDGVAEVVAGLEERRLKKGGGEGDGRRGVRGEGEWGAERGEKRRTWGGERGGVDTRRGESGAHVRGRSWSSGGERRGGSNEGGRSMSTGGDVSSVPWLREGGRSGGGVGDFTDGARAAGAGKTARAGWEGREGREGGGVWAGGEVVERRGRGRMDKGARGEGGVGEMDGGRRAQRGEMRGREEIVERGERKEMVRGGQGKGRRGEEEEWVWGTGKGSGEGQVLPWEGGRENLQQSSSSSSPARGIGNGNGSGRESGSGSVGEEERVVVVGAPKGVRVTVGAGGFSAADWLAQDPNLSSLPPFLPSSLSLPLPPSRLSHPPMQANQKQTPSFTGPMGSPLSPPFSPLHTHPAAAAHPLLNSNSNSNSAPTTSSTHPGMSPALRALITGRAGVGAGSAAGGMGLVGADAFAGQRGFSSAAGGGEGARRVGNWGNGVRGRAMGGVEGGTVLSRRGGPLGGTAAYGSGIGSEKGWVRSIGGRAGSVTAGAGGGAEGVGGMGEDMWDRLESEMSAKIEEGARGDEGKGKEEEESKKPATTSDPPFTLPDNLDGPAGSVFLIDKPKTWTSFDVCGRLRHLLGIKKVGHAGTLDPMATGLLVVCVGRATKLADTYQAQEKEYSGVMKLGEATPSLDADTEVCERSEWEGVTGERLREAAEGFLGECLQVPPAFSALKVGGVRAYTMARKGQDVELKARPVRIEAFDVWREGDGEGRAGEDGGVD